MAHVNLKNEKLLSPSDVDHTKTRVARLASEKRENDLYRQVHLVTFSLKSGRTIDVITVNDASNEECSMSAVDVFVVSKRMGGDSVPFEIVTAPKDVMP